MPRRHTTAKILVREALLLAACAMLPAVAWAARPVPVFQVDVAGQSGPALQQAMRAALVRATGRQESASDPVFAGVITDAPKYVQSYDRGPRGELQVLFDGAAWTRPSLRSTAASGIRIAPSPWWCSTRA